MRVFALAPNAELDRSWRPPPTYAEDGFGQGRWFAARNGLNSQELTPEQLAQIEKLESLGYMNASIAAPHASGVTHHEADRTAAGLNFMVSGHAPEALLIDMEGRVVHRWSLDPETAWPETAIAPEYRFFRRAHLSDDGTVLAIFEGYGMVKIDRDSNLIWQSDLRIHHDLQVMPNGEIYTLDRKAFVPEGTDIPVLEDFIVVLGADGSEERRISLLDAVQRSAFDSLIHPDFMTGDIFHTNSVTVLEGQFADEAPWLAEGRILTSFRQLDAIAIVDPATETIEHAWRGTFTAQHDPKILSNGNLLLFDNEGPGNQSSRAIEFDPVTDQVVWVFEGSAELPFYTASCGAAQRLANGNTLLTESDAGRAIEVTREGDLVWEFINPYRGGEDGSLIAALLEVVRLPPAFSLEWLPTSESPAGNEDEGERANRKTTRNPRG